MVEEEIESRRGIIELYVNIIYFTLPAFIGRCKIFSIFCEWEARGIPAPPPVPGEPPGPPLPPLACTKFELAI